MSARINASTPWQLASNGWPHQPRQPRQPRRRAEIAGGENHSHSLTTNLDPYRTVRWGSLFLLNTVDETASICICNLFLKDRKTPLRSLLDLLIAFSSECPDRR